MKQCFTLLFLAFTLLFTMSCSKVLMFTFGIRNPKEYSEKDILKEAKKQGIPEEMVFTLDTMVNEILNNPDTTKQLRWMIKNHS